MSYSFDFTVADKASAKQQVRAELDEVVRMQPAHSQDRDAALAAAHTFIDMLVDDEAKDIRVNVHGSVGWNHNPDDPYGANNPPLMHASVGVSAWHVPKAVSEPA
ncbi:hypothetical protein PQQ75_25620 [Paraburkholderia aspalathi]|uniref:hypothetical protein n=1 Tax=Paraburkholderia aspalathi TaxID=1324617 RepID=UPI0038B8F868